jgi:hypothetical protein
MDTTTKQKANKEPLHYRLFRAAVMLIIIVLGSVEIDASKLNPEPFTQHTHWGLGMAAVAGMAAGMVGTHRSKKENMVFSGLALVILACLIWRILSAAV